jgi:hypothetical protein
MSFDKLSPDEEVNLRMVAAGLGIDPAWLYKEIDFESEWNPRAVNGKAHGLIQFEPTSAVELGYVDALDLVTKNPTRISQLVDPVWEYLKKYAPFHTEQSLCMAVFYPAYRFIPLDSQFPSWVTADNSGIKTPRDYLAFVFGKPYAEALA